MPKREELTLEIVNERLKAAKTKVSVRQRGSMLSLVATLPPKPGSDRSAPSQQMIALGVPASEAGLKRAEMEARRLGSLLALKEFDWSLYLSEEKQVELNSTKNLIERFKSHYMSTHSLSEKTWVEHWHEVYKRLPQDEPLAIANMMALVEASERNTRKRLHTCKKLQKLADFAGIQVNLVQYQGDYGNSKVQRYIPSDEDIIYWHDRLSRASWRWFYGIMATYGLRDHEAFFCEHTDDGLLVTQGKTGARLVFAPLYPEWVERWNLREKILPKLDLSKGYLYLSDRAGLVFRRNKVPFTPYALRHAYAIRASVTFGFPVTTAAALMGHSPEVHYKTYVRHISQKQNIDAAKRIMEALDRPKPPDVGMGLLPNDYDRQED